MLNGGRTLNYRPDIDGLRAIACLAVVLFHAFPSLLQGGFIGVDVFFVISGYLISSIIYRNLFNKENPGSLNIVDFYIRRIKRIFPALITILIFCLIQLSTLCQCSFAVSFKYPAGTISRFLHQQPSRPFSVFLGIFESTNRP